MNMDIFVLLEKALERIIKTLGTPLAELTPIEFMTMLGVGVLLWYFFKYAVKAFLKYSKKGVELSSTPIKNGWKRFKKHRRDKKICPVCKNPLHKCTCPSNRGVPYRIRVKKWKKEQKLLRQARKQKELDDRLRNIPVETKKKRNNKGNRGGR